MRKSILCLALIVAFLLSGCDNIIDLEVSGANFYDEENDILYVPCAERAVKPLHVGEEYATDGELTYYKIPWQEPTEFICDSVEGVSFVYRASTVEDITVKNFNPIAIRVYLEGTNSQYLTTFYCEQKYLDEEDKNVNLQDDSALVYSIRDSLINDEKVTVNAEFSTDNMYYFRLLSQDYPGLYYSVVYLTDVNGEQYLLDRGTNEYILARDDLVARMGT